MQHDDSGAGRIKALLSIAFLVCVVFAGIKIIPVYVNNYELNDFIGEQTPFWLTQRASADAIRNSVVRKAQDLGLPVSPEQVKIDASQLLVSVSVDYTVPIDLLIFTWSKRFTDSSENRQI